MIIYFPKNTGQRYYASHYSFFFNLLKFLILDIELYNPEPHTGNNFIFRIDKKCILIDYGDHHLIAKDWQDFDIQFRFHYSKKAHGNLSGVFPLTPISFYDWNQYTNLQNEINYTCNTNKILNNQTPGAEATQRRIKVQQMLRHKYHANLDTNITNKETFWKKINQCLVSVCVPGARNDILDRGQFQYMAFGACTLSPKLNIIMPYMKKPESGIHYVECASDYSNLIEKIEWCKQNRTECIEIGQNAKRLFLEICIPSAIWRWMSIIMKEPKHLEDKCQS